MNERPNIMLEESQPQLPLSTGEYLAKKPNEQIPLTTLDVVGLFAGIGGFEEGFRLSGHHASFLCRVPIRQRVACLRSDFQRRSYRMIYVRCQQFRNVM